MSLVLPRRVLKGFYVGLLVLNCWLPSIVHRFVENEATRRLLCRMGDTVLDFLSSIGVSVIIAVGYVGDYVPALRDLDPERWRDNKWVINITNEGPYFLFGSWIDAFSRIVFSVGLLSSLRSVRGLIAPQKPRRVAPVNIEQRSIAEVSIGIKMRSDTPGHGSRAVTFGHRSFCLIGLGILVAHLHSELRSRPPSYCGLGVWPWLASTPNCRTIELNCKNCEFDGRASEIDVFLHSFRVSGLRELSVRHCSHVEFVQELQTLRGIFLLSVYNLTVVRWEREAALSDESHPQLRKAVFSRVRFPNSTLPSALLPPRFPSLLEILKFEATNIETIPSDVHSQWPLSLNLEISMSDVKEVPLTLLKAEMNSLTLNFNRITSVPNEVLTSASVKVVGLSGNPIRELPENVERAAITLGSLSVVFTELEALPPWGFEPNNPDQFFVIWASGTPLCNAFEAANISVPNVICWMSVVQNASAAFLDSEGGEEEFW